MNPKLRRVLFLFLLLQAAICRGADLYLSAGQTYVFDFNTFSLLRPTVSGDPTDGTIWGFTGGNWSAQVDFFQDSVSDPVMFTDVRSHSGAEETIGYGVQFGYAPWPDFQGVVRVTGLSGTFRLDGMRCDEVVNGGYYSTGWIVPQVPEPSMVGLTATLVVLWKLSNRSVVMRL